MRCHKRDEGTSGCIAKTGHKGKCTIRPNPDAPRPETWSCAAEGCERRVKTDGARCPVHRGMMNRGVRRGRHPAEGIAGAAQRRNGIRPAAPTDATEPQAPRARDGRDLVKRRIEALTVYDVIASKAARKALVGLGRALLAMFDKPEVRWPTPTGKQWIIDHGGGPCPPPWPLECQIFVDADNVEWLLCSDGLWTRVDRVEKLIPSKGDCSTCGMPLHRGWPHRKCRWCRRMFH
jgi:hypothetical protein